MDIITMARELGKLIQQDERYKRIDAAKKRTMRMKSCRS